MSGSILGRAVRRVEDPELLTGAARFVDDLPVEDGLHAVFVRSTMPHGRITGLDTAEARGMPGVVRVFVAADLDLPDRHDVDEIPAAMARPVLARDVVRFVGEPVAVVVAESRSQAMDAAEAIFVDLDPLPAIADAVAAQDEGAPLLFPSLRSNVAARWAGPGAPRIVEAEPAADDDVLRGSDVAVQARFVNQRVAPVPMETNGVVAAPDGEGGLRAWVPSQSAFTVRGTLARALGLESEQVHVISPPVGGGFGAKFDAYPEQVAVCAIALRLGRPVRHLETRAESMVAMTHGRGQVQDVELGATRDGRITGLRVRVIQDCGAYPTEGALLPELTGMMAPGAYAIPRVDFGATCVATNTTPIAAYRGAGRPEASGLIERAVDLLAAELGLDPAEVRRRNFVPPDAFPYVTACGQRYDSGDYAGALDRALELVGYEALRRKQAERRERCDRWLLGIGISSYVEITAWGPEFGSVEVRPTGEVTVLSGLGPTGQGHRTALAQIVSATMGVPFEAVTVVHSDTRLVTRGEGTGGSRSLQIGGSAVLNASRKVLDKARAVGAHLLEAAFDDMVLFDGGRMGVAGAPDTALPLGAIAEAAADPSGLPEGIEPGLAATADFRMDGNTFPFGTHVSVVEVDAETGLVRPVRHVAVDDCGRILNPMLVDGQVHGGIGQGLAQALYEEALYDEDAYPLTASLMSYAMPGPPDVPPIEAAHTETDTPLNPLGAKGIGESATVGSTTAVQNAVIDALSHLGVRHVDMPCTPERVWRAIREAKG